MKKMPLSEVFRRHLPCAVAIKAIAGATLGAALTVTGVLLGTDGVVRHPIGPAMIIVAGVALVAVGLFALARRPGAANDR